MTPVTTASRSNADLPTLPSLRALARLLQPSRGAAARSGPGGGPDPPTGKWSPSMPTRLAIAVTAAAAFAVTPALAARGATHDDTTYPEASAIWAGGIVYTSTEPPAGHEDTAYPGAHITIVKEAPLPAQGAVLATLDDTAYPTADEWTAGATPSEPAIPAPARLACGCARGERPRGAR
jgi:hypothetical protein